MAWPLLGLAAAGAISKLGQTKAKANQASNERLLAEDRRQREQSDWELRELPALHGSEQRKSMGNVFAHGMWGNFGRDPRTGVARSQTLRDILADPWQYRSTSKLAALSPHLKPLPKLKGPGFLDYLGSAAGGAASGAAAYYGMGGTAGMKA